MLQIKSAFVELVWLANRETITGAMEVAAKWTQLSDKGEKPSINE